MKIVCVETQNETVFGVLQSNLIYSITNSIFSPAIKVNDTKPIPIQLAKLKACIPNPSKIICVLGNYRKPDEPGPKDDRHSPPPPEPDFFLKPPSALIGPEEVIRLPEWSQAETHFQAGLAVVIKKEAKNISHKDFAQYILGYTVMNDVFTKAPDPTPQAQPQSSLAQHRGRGLDTFCPIGPCIETTLNPQKLRLQLRQNNEMRQQGSTEHMITPIAYLLSYISHYMTLFPGDIIGTGTPTGAGSMKAGDVIEVDIEKIGCLRNYVG